MELCNVKPNQRYIGKLDEKQLLSMTMKAATTPQERFQKIENGRKTLHEEKEQIEILQEWGVSVNSKPAELTGRVLEPPKILSGLRDGGRGRGGGRGGSGNTGNRPENGIWPENGVWRLNSYFKPAELKYWSVLIVGDKRSTENFNVDKFIKMVSQEMSSKGMKVDDWNPKVIDAGNWNNEKALMEANKFSRKDGSGSAVNLADLIIVVLCQGAVCID
ncbi:hypothetical protein HK096_011474 [Nowakowskiella sp. JEL0078]|nr:hypothetical protein HK096_011474 [Nowakowskiella sp. JEL0078]